MAQITKSLAVRLLERLADAVFARRGLFLYPQVLLMACSVYYTATHLRFDMDRNSLVGSEKQYHRWFLEYQKEFAVEDDLVAVVESADREKNRQFVERLGRRVEAETNTFKGVFYRGDLKIMGAKALLFLPPESLTELHETLRKYRPFIQHFAQAKNLNSLFHLVNQQFRTAGTEQNTSTDALVEAIPALSRIIEQATASLRQSGEAVSPGVAALLGGGEDAEGRSYITFDQGRLYVVSARAVNAESRPRAVNRLRELARQTQTEVTGVNVGITGEPVLEYDEMQQSQQDSTIATVVALVLTAVIFIVAYRETGRPLKATLCLLVGLAYTMGFTTLVVGHLNILTITFLPILIGLAIDFGVHLITRYEEELRAGAEEQRALQKAMVNTGKGIFTGCFTTAGAFFAMTLTDFKGIQEMGIITGAGMLLCLVPMLTLLPVLLLSRRQRFPSHTPKQALVASNVLWRSRLQQLFLKRPGVTLGATGACCVLAGAFARTVSFDYNLLNMQSAGLSAVEFEKKLIHSGSKSVLFAVVVANSVSEARAWEARLTNLPTVASVDSMTRFLGDNSTNKLEMIRKIKMEIASFAFQEPDRSPVHLAPLRQTLFGTQGYAGAAATAVQQEARQKRVAGETEGTMELTTLQASLTRLKESVRDLRQALNHGDAALHARRLAGFQQALLDDVRQMFQALKHQETGSGLQVEDLPDVLRQRFVGQSGKHLLQVYPHGNVWERETQERFIQELRTVQPEVTGTPVQLYEYTTLLKLSYEAAAWYALGAIALLVLLHFRNLSSVFLALLPVGIGTLWLVGIMGALGISFNPANIMTLPLVIGIGVTNGIHILNRFAEEQHPDVLGTSTGKAVLVSGLTTIAGFGSLMPAAHQGISSLGFVMAVGTSTCMAAALIFLPAVLTLSRRQHEKA